MGEESSSGGRKWEEDIYWTHFKSLHFFLSLPQHFRHQLAIPKKFTNNLREKLAESVALKGPSGATWTVVLTASGDTLLLKDGWEDFVVDHSLKEDDFLVFKYNGDSRFDVLIFDPLSCCEKEASYFVRKSARVQPESGCRTKRNITEVTDDSFYDAVGSTPSRKLRKDSTTMPIIAEQSPQANRRMSGAISSKPSKDGKQGMSGIVGGYRTYFVSNRRPVTEEEITMTLQMAVAASTKNGLVVVMRPSHVYKGFFMGISSEWANAHLPRKSQDVILRVGQHTWKVKLYRRQEGGCGLMGGWKNFAAENFLEEFDACLFELDDDDTNDDIVMDVKIFRVVEDVVPSRLMSSTPPKGRRPSKQPRRR